MLHDVVVVWLGSCNNVAPGYAHWFDFQLATCRNASQHGDQTHATCCAQQCFDMLRRNVAIVLPGLANTGPTMFRYVKSSFAKICQLDLEIKEKRIHSKFAKNEVLRAVTAKVF